MSFGRSRPPGPRLRAESKRVRWLVRTIVILAIVLSAVGTTTASEATYTYDAPVLVPADAYRTETGAGASRHLAGRLERSASRSAETRSTSTTSRSQSVATEVVPTVRHYTTSEAAESIIKGGEITPGSSGNIWVTPDRYVNGATAQSRLALSRTPDGYFEIPLCRVSCPSPPSTVQPWGRFPGGGIEITTTSPIDITGLSFKTFGPR